MIKTPPKTAASTSQDDAQFLPRALDLLLWIEDKRQSYEEPDRKGIPRDEQKPMPLKKHSAALFMLLWRNRRIPLLEQVAKSCGASNTLIRKWLAEPRFKESINQLRDEYLDGFFTLFLKLLKDLDVRLGMTFGTAKKDNFTRKMETRDLRSLMLLLDIADDKWGWLLQERAHQIIQEELRKGGLKHAGVFLRWLDMICHVRSKKKLKMAPGYFSKLAHEFQDVTHRLYFDLSVAADRNDGAVAKAYGETLAILTMMWSNKLCQHLAQEAGQKDGFESWSLVFPRTPSGLESFMA